MVKAMSDPELKRFRAEKDRVFAQDPNSPLTPSQRDAFEGLDYFDENPGLAIHGTVDRSVEPGEVRMGTSAGDDHVTIDFNYAYNPNCAYDPSWSCPLPPPENWLKVPIRAGEKTFAAGHEATS